MAIDKSELATKLIRLFEDVICLEPEDQRTWAQDLTIARYRKMDDALVAEIRRLRTVTDAIIATRRELKGAILGEHTGPAEAAF